MDTRKIDIRTIGIGIFTAPQAGGAYQYTRSVLSAISKLSEKGNLNAIVYSEYELWKPICDSMGLVFKRLEINPINKCIYHLGYILNKCGIVNSCFYSVHPLWRSYKKDKLDAMLITSPSYYGKRKGAKLIMPIFDIMHRYIDFEEIGGGDISKERDRRYSSICKVSDIVLADSKLGVEQICECYGQNEEAIKEKVKALTFIVADYVRDDNQGKEVEIPEKYIIYPAQFWKHKNHVNLIKALGELKKKGIIVKLLFTGSGKNAQEDINSAIKECGVENQITNLGYVDDDELVYLYRHARAMIFPSYGGPTNIPPIEALALGCPVAVSNNFAMPEQIGDAGLTFAPDSVEEISEAMRSLWEDDELCDKLKQKGYSRSKEWTINQFSDRLLEIISEII